MEIARAVSFAGPLAAQAERKVLGVGVSVAHRRALAHVGTVQFYQVGTNGMRRG